jgi:hypothetical protein
MMTAPPLNDGCPTRRLHGRILAKDVRHMQSLTKDQRRRVDESKNEIKRKIQQMLSSGLHDLPAIKVALQEIVGDWK